MSLLYKFREFDLKTCKSYRILGFRIFFCFPEDTKLQFQRTQNLDIYWQGTFTLLPWIILTDSNTNAKQQQICPNVSIQKKALKLVLCPPEWK